MNKKIGVILPEGTKFGVAREIVDKDNPDHYEDTYERIIISLRKGDSVSDVLPSNGTIKLVVDELGSNRFVTNYMDIEDLMEDIKK